MPRKTRIGDSLTKEERFYYPSYVNKKEPLYLVEMISAILDEEPTP